jgi:hypothetical protein
MAASVEAPPHGVTLAGYARISARVAEGDSPTAKVIEAEGLDDPKWTEINRVWLTRMGDDARARGVECTLAIEYSDAFGRAQDAIKPVVEMTAEDWATLMVEIQQTARPVPALAIRGLSQADFSRLVRHWAKRLATDPEQNARFMQVYESMQPGRP